MQDYVRQSSRKQFAGGAAENLLGLTWRNSATAAFELTYFLLRWCSDSCYLLSLPEAFILITCPSQAYHQNATGDRFKWQTNFWVTRTR